MSVTISQAPQLYSPGYNDLIFVVTSTNKTQSNFKYIADIYVGGVSTGIRLNNIPDPVYGSGVFNIGRIIENYINSDILKTTYGFQQNVNSYARYVVKFGEEYGPSSGTTVYPNLNTDQTRYAWNATVDFLPFQSYSSGDYIITSGTVGNFLTDQPSNIAIRDSEDAWLYGATDTSGTIFDARVRTYDSAGSLIQTVIVSNPYQDVASTNYRFVRFGCGTNNLNLISSSGITSGAQPIITASVASYDVCFRKSNGTVITNLQTYTINNACTRNTTYRFHFLNQLGGFDSFTFIRGSNKTVEIKRSNYKRPSGALTSASTYGYSKTDRGTVQYNTVLKDNIKVKSDWISEDISVWLEQLYSSPEIYYDDPSYGLVAVNVQNTKYEKKQAAQEKLFNWEIEFEPAYDRYRQRY